MLFLDSVSVLFIHATYFAKTDLPSGMWLLPWHLMSASADILFKGLPSIPFSARLTSPLFSHPPTLPTPTPTPFLLFVMLSLSLRGHTVTLFTGSYAGVRCVCVCVCASVCVCMCTHFSSPRSLWSSNQIRICQSVVMHTLYSHMHIQAGDWLAESNLSNNLSINAHLYIYHVLSYRALHTEVALVACLSVSPLENAESPSSPHVP